MRKSVKTLVLSTISLLFLVNAEAQLKIGLPNGVGPDIKKVIEDYPNRFANLIGEMIMENPQSTEYQCNFKVTGAEESSITRYSAKSNNVYSWEALMLSTESFDKARQKFKSLFSQLNNLTVKPGTSIGFHLKGDYEAPVEEKKFATVLFNFTPADEAMKKLKVEISLQYELTEWKVKVLVYDRDRDDDERGKQVE